MRERVEDLGRLAVLLRQMVEESLSDSLPGRVKDFSYDFYQLSVDQQHDLLDKLAYGIRSLEEKIHDCISIAEGTDYLNSIE